MVISSLRKNIMIADMTYQVLVMEFSSKLKKSGGPYKVNSPSKVDIRCVRIYIGMKITFFERSLRLN